MIETIISLYTSPEYLFWLAVFFGACLGMFFVCYFCYVMYKEVKKLCKSS